MRFKEISSLILKEIHVLPIRLMLLLDLLRGDGAILWRGLEFLDRRVPQQEALLADAAEVYGGFSSISRAIDGNDLAEAKCVVGHTISDLKDHSRVLALAGGTRWWAEGSGSSTLRGEE
jgi:hypothetical protein